MATFKEVPIGQSFDWVNDAKIGYNSFFLPCQKISARRYRDSQGKVHRLGSVSATVYHVGLYTAADFPPGEYTE